MEPWKAVLGESLDNDKDEDAGCFERVPAVKRSTGHTHTHTPTEKNTPDNDTQSSSCGGSSRTSSRFTSSSSSSSPRTCPTRGQRRAGLLDLRRVGRPQPDPGASHLQVQQGSQGLHNWLSGRRGGFIGRRGGLRLFACGRRKILVAAAAARRRAYGPGGWWRHVELCLWV